MFNIRLKDIFLIPNLFSLLRILLVIPFTIFLLKPDMTSKIISISIAGFIILTDFLDGLLARKLNQVSELGKILDPLADKIAFISIAVVYVIFKSLPIWIMIYIVVRDVVIFLIGSLISKKEGKVIQSNIWGKISTTILALAFVSLIIFEVNGIPTATLLFIGLLMFTFATIVYFIYFLIPTDEKTKKKITIIVGIVYWVGALVLIYLAVFGYIIMPDPFFAITFYS
jgi:cardiolipin synthase (CMP-forming)